MLSGPHTAGALHVKVYLEIHLLSKERRHPNHATVLAVNCHLLNLQEESQEELQDKLCAGTLPDMKKGQQLFLEASEMQCSACDVHLRICKEYHVSLALMCLLVPEHISGHKGGCRKFVGAEVYSLSSCCSDLKAIRLLVSVAY